MAAKTMKMSHAAWLLSLCAPVLFTACGGGSDGDASSPQDQSSASAEGVYGGGLTGSAVANDFQALVLENNEFWSIYGDDLGSVFYVYGFAQGSGVANNGSFSVSSVKDFGESPALSGSMTAHYDAAGHTMAGSVSYGVNGSIGFSGGAIPGSLYNYNTPASLSTVVGAWTATSSYGNSLSITVASNGALTVRDGTCVGTGTINPRASGKNVFNLAVTFGFSGCALPGASTTGIAIAYPLSTGQTQIIAAIMNSTRTEGISAFGIR
jgi:hypothetical protein